MPWLSRIERERLEAEAMRQWQAEQRALCLDWPFELTKWDRLLLWVFRISVE